MKVSIKDIRKVCRKLLFALKLRSAVHVFDLVVIGLSRLCALEFESRSEQVVLDREKLSGAVDLLGKLETVKLPYFLLEGKCLASRGACRPIKCSL